MSNAAAAAAAMGSLDTVASISAHDGDARRTGRS